MSVLTPTILCIVIGVCLALWLPPRIKGYSVGLTAILLGFVLLIISRFV